MADFDDNSSMLSKNSIMSKLSNIIEFIPDVTLRNKSKANARKLRSEYLRIRSDNVILKEENNVLVKTVSVLQSKLEALESRYTHLTSSHQTLQSKHTSLRLEQFQSNKKVQEQKQSEQRHLLNAETLSEYAAIIRYNQQRDKDLLLHIVTSIHKLELLTIENTDTVAAQLKAQLLDVRDKLLPSNSHNSSNSSSHGNSSISDVCASSSSSNQLLKPIATFRMIPSAQEETTTQSSSSATQHPTLVLGATNKRNRNKHTAASKLTISTSSNDLAHPITTKSNIPTTLQPTSRGAFAPSPVFSSTVQSAPSPRSMLGLQNTRMSYDLHTGYPFSISNITTSSTSNISTVSGMNLSTQPPNEVRDINEVDGNASADVQVQSDIKEEGRMKKKNKRSRDGTDSLY